MSDYDDIDYTSRILGYYFNPAEIYDNLRMDPDLERAFKTRRRDPLNAREAAVAQDAYTGVLRHALQAPMDYRTAELGVLLKLDVLSLKHFMGPSLVEFSEQFVFRPEVGKWLALGELAARICETAKPGSTPDLSKSRRAMEKTIDALETVMWLFSNAHSDPMVCMRACNSLRTSLLAEATSTIAGFEQQPDRVMAERDSARRRLLESARLLDTAPQIEYSLRSPSQNLTSTKLSVMWSVYNLVWPAARLPLLERLEIERTWAYYAEIAMLATCVAKKMQLNVPAQDIGTVKSLLRSALPEIVRVLKETELQNRGCGAKMLIKALKQITNSEDPGYTTSSLDDAVPDLNRAVSTLERNAARERAGVEPPLRGVARDMVENYFSEV